MHTMAMSAYLCAVFIFALSLPNLALASSGNYTLDGVPLPADWIYGCATSAYQIEGAWNTDGKGVSIWDTFAHETGEGHISGDATGDVAVDF